MSIHLPDLLRHSLHPERRHHALLLCQLPHLDRLAFLKETARVILCQDDSSTPDCSCQSCRFLRLNQHPDLLLIQAEKAGGAIKIEQIRSMLSTVFLSPKLSTQRVILLSPAEQLNAPAANALLKVLEEPPVGVYFILSADNAGLLLPTIISRCQIWHIHQDEAWMSHCSQYVTKSLLCHADQAPLLDAYPSIINDLQHVITKKTSICLISSKWQSFQLINLLQLLYCIVSQLIRDQINGTPIDHAFLFPHVRLPISVLFQALDYLHAVFEKINHTIHINTLLVIENFLMILMKEECDEYGR